MKPLLYLVISFLVLLEWSVSATAQICFDSLAKPYEFSRKIDLAVSPVKNQAASGTCWSFATTSFLESEIIRLTGDTVDLSEMYFVRKAYEEKASRYVRLHGTSNFGEGGQAHDVLNMIRRYGLILQTSYPGLGNGQKEHNHAEMEAVLKAVIDALVKNPAGKLSPEWNKVIDAILDTYLGPLPAASEFKGKSYPANDLVKRFNLDPDQYIELTSYNHLPYYSASQLELPDNWAMEKYYNVPVDDLVNAMVHALEAGYTVCWDGDVSNKGFSHKNNLALVPDVKLESPGITDRERWEQIPAEERSRQFFTFKKWVPEKTITQDMRQQAFNEYSATDDHLMHITGLVTDQTGTRYFLTKNSWSAESNDLGGYLYMSENYVRLYTIAIMVNKDSLPKELLKKLNLR